MLTEKMYVRCPADKESISDPRVFVCGQIIKVDDFKKTVRVRIYDPLNYLAFFEDLPKGVIELPKAMVQHCSFFLGSTVYVNNKPCKVLSYLKAKDGFYYYYLQVKMPFAQKNVWNYLYYSSELDYGAHLFVIEFHL